MTHRYIFQTNPDWRRNQILRSARETDSLNKDRTRRQTTLVILVCGICIIGICAIMENPGKWLHGFTPVCLATAGTIVILVALANILQANQRSERNRIVTEGLNGIANGIMPKEPDFYEKLDDMYSSKDPSKELFLLILHDPESIDITHTSASDILRITYARKTGKQHRFECDKEKFFSLVDEKHAIIKLVGEIKA